MLRPEARWMWGLFEGIASRSRSYEILRDVGRPSRSISRLGGRSGRATGSAGGSWRRALMERQAVDAVLRLDVQRLVVGVFGMRRTGVVTMRWPFGSRKITMPRPTLG